MKIEQKCSINDPPQQVWAFLIDPYQVVGCFPGVTITDKIDERTYTGAITVKLGPVIAAYKGRICFERRAPDIYEAEITGHGQEEKGKGDAEMRMASCLYALENGGTEVTVAAEVNLIGLLAQFGRRVIQDIMRRRPFGATGRCKGPGLLRQLIFMRAVPRPSAPAWKRFTRKRKQWC